MRAFQDRVSFHSITDIAWRALYVHHMFPVLITGTHYNIGLNGYKNCADIEPWFLLYNEGFLTGLGFNQFGNYTIKNRHWYEPVNSAGLRYGIPNGPQCLFDWTDLYHDFAMHVFFTAEPWNIECT